MHKDALEVHHFWFEEIAESQHWKKDTAFDGLIKNRFLTTYQMASRCELFTWRETAQGRLAEIIVLDQFARNIFRDQPQSFASDPLALALSQEAVALGEDKKLNQIERSFLYMPFMHSEALSIHEVGLDLFEANGLTSSIEHEKRHKAIIERFGRYPHRNAILGRTSTTEEREFLSQPGSSF